MARAPRLLLLQPTISRAFLRRLRFAPLLEQFPERMVWAAFVFVNGFVTIAILSALAMVTGTPLVFPSLGPTAFLVFFTPTSPSASPRHTLLGHAIGLVCGYGALWICGLEHAGPALQVGVNFSRVLAAALSLASTGALMILLKAAHPPAGATTLIVSLGLVTRPLYLVVIELAVAALALQAIAINRLAGVPYPLWARYEDEPGGGGGSGGGSGGGAGGPSPRRPELPAAALAVVAAAILCLLIYVGSRRLRDFDSALVGYAIATVFATAAIVYRYALWITRPPTWRYFMAGWRNFFSLANFRRYATFIPVTLWKEIFAQTFIAKRSWSRWVMHQFLFWGVLGSLAVTLPLTFGWVHFSLIPPQGYQLWVVGIPVMQFPIASGTGFWLFHALDITAVMVLVGLGIAFWRRFRDTGLLTSQRFGFDLTPLVLLFAICVTGLALTGSSLWWHGRFYWFISLVHQAVVVGWLLSIPFGKFFHIVQRPASVGVRLYQTVNQNLEGTEKSDGASCRSCGKPMPSAQFVRDVQGTLGDLGQNYALGGELGSLHAYCPTCKRVLRGRAYNQLLGGRFL